MKKLFLVISCFSAMAFSFSEESLKAQLDAKNYEKVCDLDVLEWAKNRKDEASLSIFGDACAQSDWINRLSTPITLLRATPEGRLNAVVFATLLYKKKLLQAALIDGLDIKMIALPKIDNILSEIYDDYISDNYSKEDGKLIFTKEDEQRVVWVNKDISPAKIMLKIIKDGKTTIKEYY